MAGDYNLTLNNGPTDSYGNPLDPYATTFTIAAFRVTSPGTAISVSPNTIQLRVTFDRPIDPTTFGPGQVTLTGPGGPVNVSGVVAVAGSNNTQFDISFDPLTGPGSHYTLTLSASILDLYGDTLTPFTTMLTIGPPTYNVSTIAYQGSEIFGQSGTQTLTFTDGSVTADDAFGTINLGSNSFTLYQTTYSQVYVSSNGLITFGSGNSAYTPTNLTTSPTQAAIAAYWTDLIKTGSEPMIVYQISGNQLIIEWYNVSNYPDGSSAPMTFQAVLQLNTGTAAGDIVFNYNSVTGVGASDVNSGITVGVKDVGAAGHTVVQDGSTGGHGDPRIQTGHSVRLSIT